MAKLGEAEKEVKRRQRGGRSVSCSPSWMLRFRLWILSAISQFCQLTVGLWMRPSGPNVMFEMWLGKFPSPSGNVGDVGSASSFTTDYLHYLRANHFQGLSSTCIARPNFRQANLSPRRLNKDWVRVSEVFSILLQLPFQIYSASIAADAQLAEFFRKYSQSFWEYLWEISHCTSAEPRKICPFAFIATSLVLLQHSFL